MNLNLQFTPGTHPDGPSASEIWSNIIMSIQDENSNIITEILDLSWVLKELIDWIIENKKSILEEEPPFEIVNSSIAQGIFEFYSKLSMDVPDESVEKVYEYRVRHGLRFALRGTDIDDIYIGRLNGKHTVSLYGKKQWDYEIKLDDFFQKAALAHDFL